MLTHALLGDFLNGEELAVAVNTLADTADEYDDRIKARFGGHSFAELADVSVQLAAAAAAATPPELGVAPARPGGDRLRASFGFVALVAALAGALYAYSVEGSIWLSLFVAVLALHLAGRAIPDLITDPQKVRRALYFLLFPSLATVVLVASYVSWHMWWLSSLLGLVGGAIVNELLAPKLFPEIHAEEMLDSQTRLAHG